MPPISLVSSTRRTETLLENLIVSNQPRELRINCDGVTLSVFEWQGDDPPIVFVHGNSFHGRIWDQVIAQLPGQHCYAVDLRGHGRSDKPGTHYHWRLYADDLLNLSRQLNINGAIGVGHSLGGHTITLATARDPQLFRTLLLIDPVILRPAQYVGQWADDHYAARRRNWFESKQAMIERFKDRLPFSRWQSSVLQDYCEYGVLTFDGGFVLACSPSVEAENYSRGMEEASNIYSEIATIDIPVRILRGRTTLNENLEADFSASPTNPDLAKAFSHAVDVPLPDHSHFIPMESPELVAQHIQGLLSK